MIFLSPYIDSGRIGNLQCAHIFSIGKIGFFFRDGLPDCFIFLIRHSNVDLMDRFTVSNSDSVPRAGDGLIG